MALRAAPAASLVSFRQAKSLALSPSGNADKCCGCARNQRFPRLHCTSAGGKSASANARPLLKVAGVIGGATAISKVLGLFRELVLAAVFGVGPVVDAFGYASIIPGFFISILGGISGPLHLTMTAALSKLTKEEGESLVEEASAAALMATLCFSIFIFILAAPITDAAAPGLKALHGATRSLAILQLRIMLPSIVFATLIGIGHGRLSALRIYGIPALSPVVSSIFMIIAALVSRQFSNPVTGAVLLSVACTVGAFAQWLLQRAQAPCGFRFTLVPSQGVRKVFSLMLPAAIGSGMLQIATYTDLYFASYFPQVTASLGYANLLVMAPLGIASSAVLIPMLSTFSRLSEPSKWSELRARVHDSLFLCMFLTLPMTSVMVPLAKPMVRLVFQRYAFEASAVATVSSFVVYYALGSTFYLCRDLLVRVFYALEDGQTPFYLSTAAILANALLDWLFLRKLGFGPQGLVLATTLVNVLSVLGLVYQLSRRLRGLKLGESVRATLELFTFAGVSSLVTSFSYQWLLSTLCFRRFSWSLEFSCIAISSLLGCSSFLLLALVLQRDNFQSLVRLLAREII